MLHPIGVVFLLTWASAFGENCIKYNFESDYETLFRNDTPTCASIGQAWQLGEHASAGVTGAPRGSEKFIEPTSLSCDSSFAFHMGDGVLEVNVYMVSKSDRDQVSVFVYELLENEREVLRGTASLQPTMTTYVEGWNVIRINIAESFTGYVTFLGTKNEGSTILVDSFRFYKSAHENNCHIYDDDVVPTTTELEDIESTTELSTDPDVEAETTINPEILTTTDSEMYSTTNADFDSETTVTPNPERLEECVIYNFDHGFDSLFTDDHDLCTGFATWTLSDYSNIGIDTGNARGRSYLKPNEDLSCISAFPFPMSPNGTVEVNVYVEPVTALDHVIVLVKHVVEGGVDTVAGFYIYEPSVNTFVNGWNILRVPVNTLRSFDGYLLFLGIASEGSTVLVDSFRYIPPSKSGDDEGCAY